MKRSCAHHTDQRIEHILHRRQHTCIGAVRVLQREQVRHFLIDIDTRSIVETLLQRIEYHVLTLLQVIGGGRRRTLLADDLS